MSATVVGPARILIRGGTAAEWATSDPVLSSREAGVETDTGQVKVGNGVDLWSDLPYVGEPLVISESAARITADATLVPLSQRGAPNGVATLGDDPKIPSSQLPALSIPLPSPARAPTISLRHHPRSPDPKTALREKQDRADHHYGRHGPDPPGARGGPDG